MSKENGNIREIDIWRIIKVIWHRLWAVILVAALGGVIAFTYATYSIQPRYQTSTLMYVNNNAISMNSSKGLTVSASSLSAAQGLVDTYVVILNTRKTLMAVLEKAGLEKKYSYSALKSMIYAEAVNGTEIFQVTVTSTDPEEAALIANTIAAVLPEKIADIMDGSLVRVVDYAVVNNAKISPNTTRYATIGIIVGAVACAALLVLIDFFDDVIRGEEDLRQVLDVPILAAIPNLLNSNNSRSYGYGYGYAKPPAPVKGGKADTAKDPKGGARS
ncbi:MAG: hypothetical protein IKI63_01645 [Clostridia bacterium]|nr:hypothetical protein [Clostridia bacterium]